MSDRVVNGFDRVDDPEIRGFMVEANGARFACIEAGPHDGRLALCLHGFPDTALTWRPLMYDLASEGWRVVAPHLRGFAPTRAPADGPVGPRVLGEDANALHRALGGDGNAIIVGHDWGAAAAYAAVAQEPRRWSRIVTASWPPVPAEIDTASYEQMKRSWYVFLLQSHLGERVLAADDLALVDRLWADWSPRLARAEHVARARTALGDAGNRRLAVGHYRALLGETVASLPRSGPPLLYLHGAEDGCIGSELLSGMEERLPVGSRVVVMRETGHFPHLEKPFAFLAAIRSWA